MMDETYEQLKRKGFIEDSLIEVLNDVLSSDVDTNEKTVKCPFCGWAWTHYTIYNYDREQSGCKNGCSIIAFKSECGHTEYGYLIGEHKGVCAKIKVYRNGEKWRALDEK